MGSRRLRAVTARTVGLLVLVAMTAAACSSSQSTEAAAGSRGSDGPSGSTAAAEPGSSDQAGSTDDEATAEGPGTSDADENESEVDNILVEGEGSTTGSTGKTTTSTGPVTTKPGGSSSTDKPTETSTGPASGGLRAVEPGAKGDDVAAIQERLAKIGFAPGPADGSYGGRTSSAIKAFQLHVGLEQTGVADVTTVKALTDYRYDGLVLHAGDEGAQVEELQRKLAGGPFDPGPVDGKYGTATVQAVWALEKLADVPVDGDWGPLDEQAWEELATGKVGRPEKTHDIRWVEVDLSEQLVKVYDPGSTAPALVTHISSGSGQAWSNAGHSGNSVTPLGDFTISRRINGWRVSSLDIGRLYNPLYFNGGIAFHGALSVPLYPASHGCIRVPMHIAEYLPAELANGTPVHVVA